MRLIITFDGNGLAVSFENISEIKNQGVYIALIGNMSLVVNQYTICDLQVCNIPKRWLLLANEVYLDTRIEEDEDGSQS